MRTGSNLYATDEQIAEFLPDWENEHCRQIIIYTDPENHPRACGEHDGFWVGLHSAHVCEQCSGSDETGRDFCPVCDYCCGCRHMSTTTYDTYEEARAAADAEYAFYRDVVLPAHTEAITDDLNEALVDVLPAGYKAVWG